MPSYGHRPTDSEPMDLANLCWSRPAQTRFGGDSQAPRNRRGTGISIYIDETDVLGHVERVIAAAGERSLHEREPDRQSGLRAAEAERLVVIETDPHHR